MNELRPPSMQAADRAALAAPGWSLVIIAAARCWAVLVLLATAAGAVWRFGGFAPPMLSLFDGLGLALWLTALFLEPAWARMQSMQSRHFVPGPTARYRHYLLAVGVAALAVPLALAPLGSLLAYDIRIYVARVLTLSQLDIAVSMGAFNLLVLLLAGPSLICLSLALLTAGRAWLGRTAGTVVWMAALLIANSGVLRTVDGGAELSLGSLAELLRGRLNLVNLDPTKGLYLSDLLVEVLILPAAALGVCIVLLAWTAVRPWPGRAQPRTQPGWLAATGAVSAVGLSAWLNAGSWITNSAVNSPGNWESLLCTGATTLVAGFALLRWCSDGEPRSVHDFRQLAWGLAIIPAWAVYTLPSVYSGQVTQQLVLGLLASVLFVCATFLIATAVVDRAFSGLPVLRHAAYLVILALGAIPIDPLDGSVVTSLVRQLRQAIIFPEYRSLALPIVAVLGLVALFGLWQLAKRPAPRGPRRAPTGD